MVPEIRRERAPCYGTHQGTMIPRPQCHNPIISMGSGGPPRLVPGDIGCGGLLGSQSPHVLSRTPLGIYVITYTNNSLQQRPEILMC